MPKIIPFKSKGTVSVIEIARELLKAAEAGEIDSIVVLTEGKGEISIGYNTILDSKICHMKCCFDEHVTHRLIPT